MSKVDMEELYGGPKDGLEIPTIDSKPDLFIGLGDGILMTCILDGHEDIVEPGRYIYNVCNNRYEWKAEV